MKYLVVRIQEADFGCEERPEGYQPKVVLLLHDEAGQEIYREAADADLLTQGINEGDWVFFDGANKIIKES